MHISIKTYIFESWKWEARNILDMHTSKFENEEHAPLWCQASTIIIWQCFQLLITTYTNLKQLLQCLSCFGTCVCSLLKNNSDLIREHTGWVALFFWIRDPMSFLPASISSYYLFEYYFEPIFWQIQRSWCSGIIVPSHGTDRGSIPRLRTAFSLRSQRSFFHVD